MTPEQKKRATNLLALRHAERGTDLARYQQGVIALLQELIDAPEVLPATNPSQISSSAEPFGYFKAEPFGWTDCAETDDGAIALYTAPQPPKLSAMLDEQRQDLSDARSGWERSAESLREADEAMEKLQSELADMRFIRGIDARFCGRLALILECAILDPHGHFELACQLLEEYKAEWDKVNPSPPTFMGEPMPPERKARLMEMKANRNVPANP